MRKNYKQGLLFDYEKRLEQLQALYRLLNEGEDQILDALRKDLGKVRFFCSGTNFILFFYLITYMNISFLDIEFYDSYTITQLHNY